MPFHAHPRPMLTQHCRGPFLTQISLNPGIERIHMPNKMWEGITSSFKINDCAVKVRMGVGK